MTSQPRSPSALVTSNSPTPWTSTSRWPKWPRRPRSMPPRPWIYSPEKEERAMTESHMRRAFTELSRITLAGSSVTSIDDLLRLVTERAAALVGVERCSILLREERANLFRGCAGCSKGSPLPDDFKRWVAGVPADGV